MRSIALLLLCQLGCQLSSVGAQFSAGFQTFLNNTYGPEITHQLVRSDFAERGSFGGGENTAPANTT